MNAAVVFERISPQGRPVDAEVLKQLKPFVEELRAAVENSLHVAANKLTSKFVVAVRFAFSAGKRNLNALQGTFESALRKPSEEALQAGAEIGLLKLKRNYEPHFSFKDTAPWLKKHLKDIAESVSTTSKDLPDPFSAERAQRIAEHEAFTCVSQGQREAWKQSFAQPKDLRALAALPERTWIALQDACDECDNLDGETIQMDGEYPGGIDGPPLHPSCKCFEDLVEGEEE